MALLDLLPAPWPQPYAMQFAIESWQSQRARLENHQGAHQKTVYSQFAANARQWRVPWRCDAGVLAPCPPCPGASKSCAPSRRGLQRMVIRDDAVHEGKLRFRALAERERIGVIEPHAAVQDVEDEREIDEVRHQALEAAVRGQLAAGQAYASKNMAHFLLLNNRCGRSLMAAWEVLVVPSR